MAKEQKRHRIAILLCAGKPPSEVAVTKTASVNTVYHVKKHLDEREDLGESPRSGRPRKLAVDEVVNAFKAHPDMAMAERTRDVGVNRLEVCQGGRQCDSTLPGETSSVP